MPERRDNPRRTDSPVRCSRGRVIDISRTGMRLRTNRPFPEGTRRTITLKLHNDTAKVTAECVWLIQTSRFTKTLGLAFINPTNHAQNLINNAAHTDHDTLPILIPLGTETPQKQPNPAASHAA